jgi:O-antigen/teichoic acid export membrane protein
VFTSTALFALAYPIASIYFHEPRLAPLLQLASLVAPFLTMSDVLAGATRGFKNMSDMVIAQNFVQPLVRLVLTLLVALTGLKVWQAILIYGLADGSATVLLLYFLNRHFPLRRGLGSARRNTREFLGYSFPLWLADLMSTFRGNIQTMFIGSLNTIRGVGIFAVANQLNLVGSVFAQSITLSARPLIAELNDRKENQEQLGRLYQTTTKWIFTLNLPLILIMMLFPAQILSLFGKSFVDGATALMILSFVNLVNVGTGMCGAIVEMTGYTRLKLMNSIIRLSLSIVANYLLISRWGIVGAAVAALILELVANLLPLVQVWFLFRILPYNQNFLKPVIAGLTAVLVSLATRQFILPLTGILETILHILLLLAVYLGVTLALGLSTEEQAILTRVRRRTGFLFSRG